ncbi:MAG TPA: ATP-binding cassette domain-containing protein [Labilithrix sp.]|nr:ATP-binding cassette domain-containing protein [Labilithrix sp.]
MTVLEARGVGVDWAMVSGGREGRAALQDASFVLTPGFYGLVGANGAGKTTLLRVLAGELAAHQGSVAVRPPDATVVFCPQGVDELSDDVRALSSMHDGLAAELKGRLMLEADELDRWPTLSPGERKRWQIAAALVREPDVLLLDEPTNHLDVGARARLTSALRRFRGIGVVVSHDRQLLEELPRAILRVHDGTVALHAGRYSIARAAWEEARREVEDSHARAKARVHAVERRLDAVRRTQEATSRGVATRSRMKGPRDHDAKSMGSKVVARWADARAGRTVHVVRDELAKARAAVPTIERDRTLGGKIFATYERAPNAVLFHLDVPELRAGTHLVLRDVRVTIGREDRVRITGENGAGKTTLLRALLTSQKADDRLCYLPQELAKEEVMTLMTHLRGASGEERGRVLSVFSALGSDPERILGRSSSAAATLSPGEARKLALAFGLGRLARALVLDEPTNHLDLPTIERLEQALEGYPGAVVLVTHDDAFAAAVTSRTLHVEHGLVT